MENSKIKILKLHCDFSALHFDVTMVFNAFIDDKVPSVNVYLLQLKFLHRKK